MRKQIALSLFLKFGSIVLSFLITIVLARSMGVELRGEFAIIFSSYLIISPLVQFGAKQNISNQIKEGFSVEMAISRVSSLSFAIILSYLVLSILPIINQLDVKNLILLFLLLIVSCSSAILNGVALAIDKFSYVVISNFAQLLVTLLSLYLFELYSTLGVEQATGSYVLGFCASVLIQLNIFRRHVHIYSLVFSIDIKMIIKGFVITSVTFLFILNMRVDFFIINYLLDASSAGVYAVAVNLADISWKIPAVLGLMIFSKTATDKLTPRTKKTIWVSTLLPNLVIILGVAVLGREFINKIYGPDYSNAFNPALLMLIGCFFLSIYKLAYLEHAARGNPGVALIPLIFSLTINVILNFILIPEYGLIGAAISTAISYSILPLTLYLLSRRMKTCYSQ